MESIRSTNTFFRLSYSALYSSPGSHLLRVSNNAMEYQPSALSQKFWDRPVSLLHQNAFWRHHNRDSTIRSWDLSYILQHWQTDENVIIVLLVIEFGLILHVERLSHVHAVQPYLVGIDLLVPEVAFLGAGLGLHLAVDQVDGLAVFSLPFRAYNANRVLPALTLSILYSSTEYFVIVPSSCTLWSINASANS